MTKYEFIKEEHFGSPDWYYTKKDGVYVSDSGHSDYQRALDKYNHIVNKGELKKIAVLQTTEKEEDQDND